MKYIIEKNEASSPEGKEVFLWIKNENIQ